MKTFFRHSTCRLLIAVLAIVSYSAPVQAALIDTQQAVTSERARTERERLRGLLARSEVQRELVLQGVSPAVARDRMEALSDDEVLQLAGHLDAVPAGGEIVGILLIVVLVLLIVMLMDRGPRR
jgi:uncharacterized protein DUF6627